MLLSKEEREQRERKRQVTAIREYNQRKKTVFEARLGKFLNLYPYATDYETSVKKFCDAVAVADISTLNTLIKYFNEENKYWSTYYVLHNCNASIYQHIMTVLTLMRESLSLRIQEIQTQPELQDTNQQEKMINTWGSKGEKEVDYVLKWLPDNYYAIKKDCVSKYGDKCILLENIGFIDEKQEYDHIVVGPQGIFLIETKNYSGKLHVDEQGNWLRMKKNEVEWVPETNPLQQVSRHHVLLESIVGDKVPIIDVVCLAHPDIIATGLENSKVPVIKKDMLGDYIMKYPDKIYNLDEIENLVCLIDSYKVLQ